MRAGVVLGWREWLSLPDLGLAAVRAKVDTGARSSALHVDWLQPFEHDGLPWVRFALHPVDANLPGQSTQAPVLDRRPVTDSGGHVSERFFIATRIALAGESFIAEINLTSRRNMLFPMLLGRTALAGRFIVDPARSFVFGEHHSPQAGTS